MLFDPIAALLPSIETRSLSCLTPNLTYLTPNLIYLPPNHPKSHLSASKPPLSAPKAHLSAPKKVDSPNESGKSLFQHMAPRGTARHSDL